MSALATADLIDRPLLGVVHAGPAPYRVLVIDAQPLLAIGLAHALTEAGFDPVVAELTPVDDLVAAAVALRPDGVVLDLDLPFPGGGLGLLGRLRAAGLRSAVLTDETDVERCASCFERGAAAVMTRREPVPDVVDGVRRLCDGGEVRPQQRALLTALAQRRARERAQRLGPFDALTPREETVLAGLLAGRGPAEQAARDYVSVETVRTQIKNVLRKLGVGSQLEAVARAHDAGWEPPAASDDDAPAGQARPA
ncbi:MAG: response regulator transcription factor [Acidimicrobiales bacterium]